jgi:hypothetical protein
MNDLGKRLASIPSPTLARSPHVVRAIASCVEYLGSDAAMRSIDSDAYWPKWDSPWWHMMLLWELGEERRIPERAVAKLVSALQGLRVKIFPIHPHEVPDGADPYRDIQCHCAIGNVHQLLTACGVDVDRELPWIAAWLVSYQMADGGLSCDSDAYLITDECPSSMVGTVPVLEALLQRGGKTQAERDAADRAAGFLIDRRLVEGSRSKHNAAERESAAAWPNLCFPRFYLYDVLRGLTALVRWTELGAKTLPLAAVEPAIEHLVTSYPDGVVSPRRHSWAGARTLALLDGAWGREPASTFPLLEVAGPLGEPNEPLTRRWTAVRKALLELIDDGRIAGLQRKQL